MGHAREQPGACVAKAFASIVPPDSRQPRLFPCPHFFFGNRGRFTEFATGAALVFQFKQFQVGAAPLVAEARPGKMENFVGKNEPQQRFVGQQHLLEHNQTTWNEARRVNRNAAAHARRKELPAIGREFRAELQTNRAALYRQPGTKFKNPSVNGNAVNERQPAILRPEL